MRRAWLPILAKGEIIKGVSNGVKDAGKYEEWISAEILNLIVTYTGKCASKTTPVMVEVPVDTATLEVEELKLVGVDKVKDGDATVTVNAIYRYTSKATLHNLPQLLIDAAVQLDFGHEEDNPYSLDPVLKEAHILSAGTAELHPSRGMEDDAAQP